MNDGRPMSFNDIEARLQLAKSHGHRQGIVLNGGHDWCLENAEKILERLSLEKTIWLTDEVLNNANVCGVGQSKQLLGQETDCIVFDAHCGFDPDAFGALCGTIRSGGLLLLLTPSFDEWADFDDPSYRRFVSTATTPKPMAGRFLRRLQRVIVDDPHILVFDEDSGGHALDTPVLQQCSAANYEFKPGATDDQAKAIVAVAKVVTGHRRRPVVLLSDRGRGKSAAFGLAAAQCLENGLRQIIVTAPTVAATEALFSHAHRALSGSVLRRGLLTFNDARIQFIPPDKLAAGDAKADLLLVDEAAAIPTPLLGTLLAKYSRLAFATTVHGYEGTGQGFATRFFKTLDAETPGWTLQRLSTPIRWAQDDPLEKFVFQALLLDAELAAPVGDADVFDANIDRLDRELLLNDEALLSQIFGLLVTAHYRTRAIDLMQLLDDPSLDVWVSRINGRVVATALVLTEGPLAANITQDIFDGHRRVRGHLIPQTFVAHLGIKAFSELVGWRVMRIAVHPANQDTGLGTQLLTRLCNDAAESGLHWIGSSFGATDKLVRFWRRADMWPVRLGTTREASSGVSSVLVLKPLSSAAMPLYQSAREQFLLHLPHQLSELDSDSEPRLILELMTDPTSAHQYPLTSTDLAAVTAFACHQRNYEACAFQLWTFVLNVCAEGIPLAELSSFQQALIVAKILHKKPWSETAQKLNLNGRSETLRLLRAAIKALLEAKSAR